MDELARAQSELARDLARARAGEDRELVTLLFTCVGVPEYVGRPGGAPGAPVPVRMVTPRLR